MEAELRGVLESEPDIAYAILFGSCANDTARPDSDADIAIEFTAAAARDVTTLGRLAARLASAVGRRIDLVLLDEAPAPLAYRIFRDGHVLVERDHARLTARKARALLDYLDFRPVEQLCASGVLRAAATRGR